MFRDFPTEPMPLNSECGGALIEYIPVIVAPHSLAKVIAVSNPLIEFFDPSNGTKIFKIFFLLS